MKYSVFLFLLLMSCKPVDKLHTEQYKDKDILVGKATRADLEKKPYNEWFDANYRDYRPKQAVVEALKPVVNQYKFVVLLGTWCGDSQEQVPILFKVLNQAGYHKKIDLYCVPRKYKDYNPAKSYDIIRVPTIIVYHDGKEIGRIIEYPMASIEEDLLMIMTSADYRHELDEREN